MSVRYIGMSPPPHVDLAGSWKGHLVVDLRVVASRFRSAEQKKLILYAISRLKKSSYLLILEPYGVYEYMLDDGYEPDLEERRGKWASDGRTIAFTDWGTRPLNKGRFRLPYHRAAGVFVEFVKAPKPVLRRG